MKTFIKAQGSSLLATATDFVVTVVLVEMFGMWYAAANGLGLIAGGATNFIVNRDWVFNGPQNKLRSQVGRYFIVWCGSWVLNAVGVYMAVKNIHLNYIVSKVLVSLIVGWFYNYTLQKRFVFKKADYVS